MTAPGQVYTTRTNPLSTSAALNCYWTCHLRRHCCYSYHRCCPTTRRTSHNCYIGSYCDSGMQGRQLPLPLNYVRVLVLCILPCRNPSIFYRFFKKWVKQPLGTEPSTFLPRESYPFPACI
ncbi:hypothetical protein EMIT0P291_190103 [Pseudomonas sp. IT-P291]